MKKYLFPVLAVLIFSIDAFAQCLMVEVPLQDRINEADIVIEGEVIQTAAYKEAGHQKIYTANTLKIFKVLKGNLNASEISFSTEGGTLGNEKLMVYPSPEVREGQRGIFFLKRVGNKLISVASAQGFIKYNEKLTAANDVFQVYPNIQSLYQAISAQAGQPVVEMETLPSPANGSLNQKQAVSISGFSPATATAGTKTILTINGSGFGSSQGNGFVSFKNADDGGASWVEVDPSSPHYISWSDTEIKIYIPSEKSSGLAGVAGTGQIKVTDNGGSSATSSGVLTIDYSVFEINYNGTLYNTDLFNDNGNGGYTFNYHTEFFNNTDAVGSFERALESWRCGTYVNFGVSATSTSNDNTTRDGENVIRFDNGTELPSGVLGSAYSYWSGCSSGGTIEWYTEEIDMIFNDDTNWEFGPATPSSSEYDFETVVLHELGHAHQLGHIIKSDAIMHYAIANGQAKRTLSTDNDIAGGNYIMSLSTASNICSGSPITALSSSNCVLCNPPATSIAGTHVSCNGGSDGAVDLSVSGGTPGYTYTWSNGATTQDISNLTAGTYTVIVEDAAGCVAYDTAVITEPPALSASANISHISCYGGNNGAIDLSVSGGTPGYTYTWSNGATTQDISNLTAGSYTVQIEDVKNCILNRTFTVTQPDSLSLIMGAGNGFAWVDVSGGTSPYDYLWNDPQQQTNDTAFNLTTGTYTVTVTDASGCSKSASIFVQVTLAENLSPVFTYQIHPNPSSGEVEIAFGEAFEGGITVKFYNLLGQEILNKTVKSKKQVLNLTLTKGVYFILLEYQETRRTEKLIIN